SGGPRDLPPRHQTLRGALELSYTPLKEGERKLFARLSVFVGGFTAPRAEAICNAPGDLPFNVLAGIDFLIDKNLVKRDEVAGESRYTILERIREYALERVAAGGEEGRVRRLHAEYYLALAEAADTGLSGPEQRRLLVRLETEHDNLRAALRWAREGN